MLHQIRMSGRFYLVNRESARMGYEHIQDAGQLEITLSAEGLHCIRDFIHTLVVGAAVNQTQDFVAIIFFYLNAFNVEVSLAEDLGELVLVNQTLVH